MEVNDYVRTEWGDIEKIIKIDNENIIVNIEEDEEGRTYCKMCYKNEIKKSSPNIIDILEVGDYVNGYLVIEKDINNELRYIDLKDRNMKYVKYLDIKSIVTKEMFSSIEYEVKQ